VIFFKCCTLIQLDNVLNLIVDKKDTFITAINENQGLIFKVASIYTNNNEDKNDLSQEIIYQLWKSFGTFQQKSSLSTWIYRVALNVAIYHLKTSKRKIKTEPLDKHFLNFQETNNSDEIEEKWQLFKQHINMLNLLDKGIVLLYLENKSHEEIAQIIGISTSNVGTKLSRIKEKLKQQILKQV
jgi:RNA polymerase sigma factor (sigma-70 family)